VAGAAAEARKVEKPAEIIADPAQSRLAARFAGNFTGRDGLAR
jgi:hypothetical protein